MRLITYEDLVSTVGLKDELVPALGEKNAMAEI